MYLTLIDKIVELRPSVSITTVKTLSANENYLQDHFPRFPVMPGVLMLEAMYQSAAWLIRAGEDFAHGVVVLKEARNVRYGGFVTPGQTLQIQVDLLKESDSLASVKARGEVAGETVVSGRLVLEKYNLAERHPLRGLHDDYTRRELRKQFASLYADADQLLKQA